MKYACVRCGFVWGNLEAGEDDVSHGICKECLQLLQKDKIRQRQRAQGYNDCYARGYDDCTEHKCEYWSICMEKEIEDWKRKNTSGQDEERSNETNDDN